ncbi:trypsin-like peptidase domain-containing protein [Cellulomonas sp. HZM]|uniref:trypsin-like peptidase domain-containing protein n=1 Tax=Cellulomonas sp. HZM TaxID=1454010 RepID=UPI0004933AA1|nr:trypsin-like peptidase domain-containing protein [Cellulomonas sp. HZM]
MDDDEQVRPRRRGRRAAVGAALVAGVAVGSAVSASPAAADDPAPLAAPTWPGLAAGSTDGVLTVSAGSSTGTALVVSAGGVAVTHRHVVADASEVSVTDPGTGRTYVATVLVSDPRADMAVLQLVDADGVTPASLV